MKRIPACIGLDQDVREYLDKQDVSMAEFINCVVRAYSKQESIRNDVGLIEKEKKNPISDELIEGVAISESDKEIECEEKIKTAILRNPNRWLVPLHKSGKAPDKGMLQDILNTVEWTCDVKPSMTDVKKVLHILYKNYDWKSFDEEEARRDRKW
jgi:hypothetical protein